MVEDAGEHRRRAGAGQLGVGPEVLAHPLHGPLVAVDADHEAVAKHQLDLLEPDGFLGGHPPDRLDLREHQLAGNLQGRPVGRRVRVVDQRPWQGELVLDGGQLGAGVAQADPDERVAARRGTLGAAPVR